MDVLNNLFLVQGYQGEFSYFWTSSVGAMVCAIIFLTSLHKIYARGMCTVNYLYEYAMAFLSASSLLHIWENTVPKHQMVTIVIAIAFKRICDMWSYYKGGKHGY